VILDDFDDIVYFVIKAATRTKHPKFNMKNEWKALVGFFKMKYYYWV
jgi:hypothetical protein